MIDQYRGHICVTRDPGCTCGDHAEALRERDRLRVELAAERERADALGRAADGMAEGVEYEHRECDASVCLRKAEVVAYRETMGGEGA